MSVTVLSSCVHNETAGSLSKEKLSQKIPLRIKNTEQDLSATTKCLSFFLLTVHTYSLI